MRRIEELLQHVNESVGATMLITSHHTQSTLRVADHLVLLQDGAAISGTTRDLLRDDPRVAEFFAEPPLRERAACAP